MRLDVHHATAAKPEDLPRRVPTMIMMMMTTTENRYVGTAKVLPSSRMPRRFPYSISSTTKMEISVIDRRRC